MGNPAILEELFDEKLLKILQLFLHDKKQQYYLREIAHHTTVPVATTFRAVKKLLKLNLIEEIKVKKFKVYQLSTNDDTAFLTQFLRRETRVIDLFVKKIREIPAVSRIILQGEEQKDRANVIIIGDNIDPNIIKKVSADINEKHHFFVSALPLKEEQFEQISNMGLYSGKKRILFERT